MSHRNHPFFDKHNPLLKAIWTVDRSATGDEKLVQLKEAIRTSSASDFVEILDDTTGEVRVKVPPLIIACFEGDFDTIKFLLDKGADPNQTEVQHNLTALHVIVDGPYKGQTLTEQQRADLIRIMVEKGANVDQTDKLQFAPVHKVVFNDYVLCLNALIEANVDPNVPFMSETALSIAVRQNRDSIVRRLLEYKRTQINFQNDNGGTLLHFAAGAMVDSPNCIDLLIKAGLDINVQDKRGNSPAMVACVFNRPSILKSLIGANANLSLKNHEGKDAITLCDERSSDECKAVLQNN